MIIFISLVSRWPFMRWRHRFVNSKKKKKKKKRDIDWFVGMGVSG